MRNALWQSLTSRRADEKLFWVDSHNVLISPWSGRNHRTFSQDLGQTVVKPMWPMWRRRLSGAVVKLYPQSASVRQIKEGWIGECLLWNLPKQIALRVNEIPNDRINCLLMTRGWSRNHEMHVKKDTSPYYVKYSWIFPVGKSQKKKKKNIQKHSTGGNVCLEHPQRPESTKASPQQLHQVKPLLLSSFSV